MHAKILSVTQESRSQGRVMSMQPAAQRCCHACAICLWQGIKTKSVLGPNLLTPQDYVEDTLGRGWQRDQCAWHIGATTDTPDKQCSLLQGSGASYQIWYQHPDQRRQRRPSGVCRHAREGSRGGCIRPNRQAACQLGFP